MTDEELKMAINELIKEIQSQKFEGNDEEIKLQQVLYFDKYIKDNIDYGFEAMNFLINNPNKNNPYDSAFRLEGFFEQNKITGKRSAVCGSISQVANIVFNRLGIKSEYIYGHFNNGTKEKPQYVGHRWNVVSIGTKNYMVDFTIEMIIHNLSKSQEYAICAYKLLGVTSEDKEYEYLFFNKLASTQSIGGFKKNEQGLTVDDINELGHLNNCIIDPNIAIPDLGYIPSEYTIKYAEKNLKSKTH